MNKYNTYNAIYNNDNLKKKNLNKISFYRNLAESKNFNKSNNIK